jgi:mRNA interferase MazF
MEEAQHPPWVKPRLVGAPKIRQLFWCDFWKDAVMPEMWKVRPIVVISYNNHLNGPCLVIPISTAAQDDNRWAHRFTMPTDGGPRWAICNQPSTVSPARLTQFNSGIPKMSEADFNEVLAKLMRWIPKPFD